MDAVPPHLRDFEVVGVGRRDWETEHWHVEDAEAVDVALLGVGAKQLHADADAEDGLSEGSDDVVEPCLSEVRHRGGCLALPWEYDFRGCPELVGVVGEVGVDAQSFEGVEDGADVSGVIFYDCYAHRGMVGWS